jgi:hypothetical protein
MFYQYTIPVSKLINITFFTLYPLNSESPAYHFVIKNTSKQRTELRPLNSDTGVPLYPLIQYPRFNAARKKFKIREINVS